MSNTRTTIDDDVRRIDGDPKHDPDYWSDPRNIDPDDALTEAGQQAMIELRRLAGLADYPCRHCDDEPQRRIA